MHSFSNNHHRAGKTGFSLIELMIVVAIVGLLATLLLPALNKARSRSLTLSCLNNLKQLQTSSQMYADEHYGILVPNNFNESQSENTQPPDASWSQGNARTDTTTANIERGLLFPYNRTAAIYHCPADLSKIENAAGKPLPQLRTRSYQMSASLNSGEGIIPSFKKYSEIRVPASIFVFLDSLGETPCFALYPGKTVWLDLPADRHYRGGNFSFADGHVERWKWMAKKTASQKMQRPANSHEMQDMLRLRAGMKHLTPASP